MAFRDGPLTAGRPPPGRQREDGIIRVDRVIEDERPHGLPEGLLERHLSLGGVVGEQLVLLLRELRLDQLGRGDLDLRYRHVTCYSFHYT